MDSVWRVAACTVTRRPSIPALMQATLGSGCRGKRDSSRCLAVRSPAIGNHRTLTAGPSEPASRWQLRPSVCPCWRVVAIMRSARRRGPGPTSAATSDALPLSVPLHRHVDLPGNHVRSIDCSAAGCVPRQMPTDLRQPRSRARRNFDTASATSAGPAPSRTIRISAEATTAPSE